MSKAFGVQTGRDVFFLLRLQCWPHSCLCSLSMMQKAGNLQRCSAFSYVHTHLAHLSCKAHRDVYLEAECNTTTWWCCLHWGSDFYEVYWRGKPRRNLVVALSQCIVCSVVFYIVLDISPKIPKVFICNYLFIM